MEVFSEIRKFSKELNLKTCPNCKSKMIMGATSFVCGHTACKRCFFMATNKCPICKVIVKPKLIYMNGHLERFLESISSFPTEESCNIGSKVEYFFTPDKGKEKKNHEGETRLHKACREGKFSDVEALTLSGVDLNVQDYATWTPLHEAVIAKKLDIARLLLEKGAFVDAPGLYYNTPLHIAVEDRNILMAELLIQYGAKLSACNLFGKSPIDLCNKKDFLLLDGLCRTVRNVSLNMVFVIPSTVVVCIDVDSKNINKISTFDSITIIDVISFLSNTPANYVIIGSTKPNVLCLQMAILQGAFIFNVEGFYQFIENKKLQNPLMYLADLPKYAIEKAVLNKMHKRPKLFDSISFFFNTACPQQIGGFTYNIEDFKHLVTAGGGSILSRRPSTSKKMDKCYPYHADKTTNLASTTRYLIFRESKVNPRMSHSDTLKCKPFSWFIECINNFSIK